MTINECFHITAWSAVFAALVGPTLVIIGGDMVFLLFLALVINKTHNMILKELQ